MLEPPSGFAGGTMVGGGLDHGSRGIHSRKRKDDRALDKDEEDYFNEDRYALVYRFFCCLNFLWDVFSVDSCYIALLGFLAVWYNCKIPCVFHFCYFCRINLRDT